MFNCINMLLCRRNKQSKN